MNRFDKRVGYAVAIVACTIVLLIRMALSDALAEQARLMPFVIAVMAAAWWGGLGPGILATLLSTFLGVLFIVPPADSLEIVSVADAVNAVIFVFLGFAISFLCEALHRARRSEAEKQFHTLADSIAQLVWMERPDGYRFWFNRRWFDYSGLTLEQLEGDGWQQVCDAAELPRVLNSWHAALAKGEAWEETYSKPASIFTSPSPPPWHRFATCFPSRLPARPRPPRRPIEMPAMAGIRWRKLTMRQSARS